MSKLIPNSFTSYELTPQEQLQGSILNTLQLQVLHNHLADIAEEKLALDYNPEHPLLYAQTEAALNGNIKFINYLIDASEAALDALNPTLNQDDNL